MLHFRWLVLKSEMYISCRKTKTNKDKLISTNSKNQLVWCVF